MSVGLVADAVRHADDPTLAAREGIFDLSSLPHALFFGGIAVAILGLFALVAGTQLYKPGQRVTVERRLLQVGAPMAAIVLIGGCAAFAGTSKLADRRLRDGRRDRRALGQPRRDRAGGVEHRRAFRDPRRNECRINCLGGRTEAVRPDPADRPERRAGRHPRSSKRAPRT